MPLLLQCASRSALFAYQAAQRAIQDARIQLDRGNRSRYAVVLGTCFGSIESVHRFDAEALRDGTRYVNPLLFPNTVINAPAGYLAACLKLRGANVTLSTGLSSGLSAVAYGQELLQTDQADVVLAGGYDELSPLLLSITSEHKLLRPETVRVAIPRPLDHERKGWVLGEGAAVFVLERRPRAYRRGGRIAAEIHAIGRRSPTEQNANGLNGAVEEALADWRTQKAGRLAVFLGANGSQRDDADEAMAIERVFKESVDVTAPKSFFGESGGANALGMAIATWALQDGFIPPTLGFRRAEKPWQLNIVNTFIRARLRGVLVNSADPWGEHVSLLLGNSR